MGPLNLIRIAVEKMAGIADSASTTQQPDYQVTANSDGSQTINQTRNVGGRYRITRPVATIPKGSIYLSPDQLQAIDDAAGGDPAKAALMRALVTQENRGFGYAKKTRCPPREPAGPGRFMPRDVGQVRRRHRFQYRIWQLLGGRGRGRVEVH